MMTVSPPSRARQPDEPRTPQAKVYLTWMRRDGAGVAETLTLAELPERLEALSKRRVSAKARYRSGEWAGEVWKNEGRWVWTCDMPTPPSTSKDGE